MSICSQIIPGSESCKNCVHAVEHEYNPITCNSLCANGHHIGTIAYIRRCTDSGNHELITRKN